MKALIGSYVDNCTKEDLENLIISNNYEVSNEELDIMFYYLKNKWESIYDGDEEVLAELKEKLSENTYNTLLNLYNIYKR